MKKDIREKVLKHEHGLYIHILFPIAVSFLLTFVGARIISHIAPQLYFPWNGVHVHHYAYGFAVLTVSGYLALVFSGPRAKYLIALLHGFGAGLAFDEFGMWIHLNDDDPMRWSYDGFLIVVATIFMVIAARPSIVFLKNHLPFRRNNPFTLPPQI